MNAFSEPSISEQKALAALPRHDDFSVLRRLLEAACIAAALGLIVWHLIRLAQAGTFLQWWLPIAVVAGALAADFVSGLVHWTADTWGSEMMPILGRRFVRPFRVHHVNPDDFLRRNVLDTNGDVAAIVAGILGITACVPIETSWGAPFVVFFVSFCIVGLPTNQVHQWAHMPRPPRCVRWLQRCGVVLSRGDHLTHHREPYARNYCIATGWCNRPLEAVSFFRRLETLVTALTGMRPREDDAGFSARSIASSNIRRSEALESLIAEKRPSHIPADRDPILDELV